MSERQSIVNRIQLGQTVDSIQATFFRRSDRPGHVREQLESEIRRIVAEDRGEIGPGSPRSATFPGFEGVPFHVFPAEGIVIYGPNRDGMSVVRIAGASSGFIRDSPAQIAAKLGLEMPGGDEHEAKS